MTQPVDEQYQAQLQAFAETHRLEFRDASLLRAAFIHRSYVNEMAPGARVEDNERLEFLGDAVISKVVAEKLYHRFPHCQEGQLTQMRSLLVRREAQSEWARQLDLGRFLRLGRSGDQDDMRRNERVLSSTLEALVGAIQTDQGDAAVHAFLSRWLDPALDELAARGMRRNPKSELQELVQGETGLTPRYELMAASDSIQAPAFEVHVRLDGDTLGIGHGTSIRKASVRAAADALAKRARPAPELSGTGAQTTD